MTYQPAGTEQPTQAALRTSRPQHCAPLPSQCAVASPQCAVMSRAVLRIFSAVLRIFLSSAGERPSSAAPPAVRLRGLLCPSGLVGHTFLRGLGLYLYLRVPGWAGVGTFLYPLVCG